MWFCILITFTFLDYVCVLHGQRVAGEIARLLHNRDHLDLHPFLEVGPVQRASPKHGGGISQGEGGQENGIARRLEAKKKN